MLKGSILLPVFVSEDYDELTFSLKGEGYLNVALNDQSYECPIELNQVVTYCYV